MYANGGCLWCISLGMNSLHSPVTRLFKHLLMYPLNTQYSTLSRYPFHHILFVHLPTHPRNTHLLQTNLIQAYVTRVISTSSSVPTTYLSSTYTYTEYTDSSCTTAGQSTPHLPSFIALCTTFYTSFTPLFCTNTSQ